MIRDEAVKLIYNVKLISAPLYGEYKEKSDFSHILWENCTTHSKEKAEYKYDVFIKIATSKALHHAKNTPLHKYKVVMTVAEETLTESIQNKTIIKEEEVYDKTSTYELPIKVRDNTGQTETKLVKVELPDILDRGQSHMTYINRQIELARQ